MLSRFLSKLRNYGKEACGFPSGRLGEQTRGRCPHILALANTRTALRAWREDLGDITRILLTAMAGLLAQWGARISDTITLCTRILLTAQDLHSKRIDLGGSSEVRGTWRDRKKKDYALRKRRDKNRKLKQRDTDSIRKLRKKKDLRLKLRKKED